MNDRRNSRQGTAMWYVTIDQDVNTLEKTNLFYVTYSGTYVLTAPVGTTWAAVVPITATLEY